MIAVVMGHSAGTLHRHVMRHASELTAAAVEKGLALVHDPHVSPAEVVPTLVWSAALDMAAAATSPLLGGRRPVTLEEAIDALRVAWEVGR